MRHSLAEIQLEDALRHLAESPRFGFLHREGFHNSISRQGFIKNVGHLGQFLLIGSAKQAKRLSEPHCWIKYEGH